MLAPVDTTKSTYFSDIILDIIFRSPHGTSAPDRPRNFIQFLSNIISRNISTASPRLLPPKPDLDIALAKLATFELGSTSTTSSIFTSTKICPQTSSIYPHLSSDLNTL